MNIQAAYRTEKTVQANKDHFSIRDGVEFAGIHLLVDLHGAKQLNDLSYMEQTLRHCIDACDATLLHIHLHHFSVGGGISGVAILAESHISIHSWPERNYAAFDIFMCGDAKPEKAVPILQQAFQATRIDVKEVRRGICNETCSEIDNKRHK